MTPPSSARATDGGWGAVVRVQSRMARRAGASAPSSAAATRCWKTPRNTLAACPMSGRRVTMPSSCVMCTSVAAAALLSACACSDRGASGAVVEALQQ